MNDEFTERENEWLIEQHEVKAEREQINRAVNTLSESLDNTLDELDWLRKQIPALIAGAVMGENNDTDVSQVIARVLYLENFIDHVPDAIKLVNDRQNPLFNRQDRIAAGLQDIEAARDEKKLIEIAHRVNDENPGTSRENIIKRVKNEIPGARDADILKALKWRPEQTPASVAAVREARERSRNQRALNLGVENTVH